MTPPSSQNVPPLIMSICQLPTVHEHLSLRQALRQLVAENLSRRRTGQALQRKIRSGVCSTPDSSRSALASSPDRCRRSSTTAALMNCPPLTPFAGIDLHLEHAGHRGDDFLDFAGNDFQSFDVDHFGLAAQQVNAARRSRSSPGRPLQTSRSSSGDSIDCRLGPSSRTSSSWSERTIGRRRAAASAMLRGVAALELRRRASRGPTQLPAICSSPAGATVMPPVSVVPYSGRTTTPRLGVKTLGRSLRQRRTGREHGPHGPTQPIAGAEHQHVEHRRHGGQDA